MSNPDAQAAGERVEALLAELRTRAGPQVGQVAEELVSCLVGLYGAGLARIVEIIGQNEAGGAAGPASRLLPRMAADPLVESLLLVHDLHPLDTSTRVRRAVEQVLPQLGSHAGAVEYLGLDESGTVRLRLELAGCTSSAATVRALIEQAVTAAAPEAAAVDIEMAEAGPPLLQIGRRPAGIQEVR